MSVCNKLIETLQKEMQEFEDSYKNMSPTQIYNDWYIIGFYNEYYEMLTSRFVEDMSIYFEELDWLGTKDKPLRFLYDKWMSCDGSFSHNWDNMLDWMCLVYREDREMRSIHEVEFDVEINKKPLESQIKVAQRLNIDLDVNKAAFDDKLQREKFSKDEI